MDRGRAVPANAEGGEQGLSEGSDSGCRSPSEWEKGSEADIAVGVGESVRSLLDGALADLGGAGPMSSEDVRRQRGLAAKQGMRSTQSSRRTRTSVQGAEDIGTIQQVQTSKMCLALCEFLESYSDRTTRVIVSHADAERAWKACRERAGDLRVVLGELVGAGSVLAQCRRLLSSRRTRGFHRSLRPGLPKTCGIRVFYAANC